jgi:transcriptional regulator with XRE-family HTH domain
MSINPTVMTIRAKKLGVLIRDARLASRRRIEDCAETLQVSSQDFEAFELGENSPSLSKLEVLAYFLGIPVGHFWGNKAISENGSLALNFDINQLTGLRQRMIGALLRQAREQSELTLEAVAEGVGIPAEQLEASELGEDELPLPVLEAVCTTLGRPIDEFIDKYGPVGVWANQQQSVQEYLKLPEELQAFISKPINRPYLELAHRLSEMSVDKLRAVGEGILEITL